MNQKSGESSCVSNAQTELQKSLVFYCICPESPCIIGGMVPAVKFQQETDSHKEHTTPPLMPNL